MLVQSSATISIAVRWRTVPSIIAASVRSVRSRRTVSFKGQTMAGRMGGERVTVQNLEVVRVDAERNLLLVKGAVPGPKNSFVTIRSAVKQLAK